jgi:spore germination cell wall hydrolase CwlJ-like protein
VELPKTDLKFTNFFAIEEEKEIEKREIYTYEKLGVTKKEFQYLVNIIFTEANLENSEGQELVVLTIMNRVQHEKFPDDVISVINAPNQFGGRWVKSWGNYTQGNVDNVINALSRIKNGELEDWEKEVLFFHNPEVDSNSYAGKYGLKILKVVGGHTFLGYR